MLSAPVRFGGRPATQAVWCGCVSVVWPLRL